MKIITIGRDTDCDIMIDDPVVSRRHALLKLYPSGKVEVVDMSSNGTFVNGMKLKNNVPTPVSKKDIVSFAHVKQLDWKQVPDLARPYKLAALAVAAIIALSLLAWGVVAIINHYKGGDEEQEFVAGKIYQPQHDDSKGDSKGDKASDDKKNNEKVYTIEGDEKPRPTDNRAVAPAPQPRPAASQQAPARPAAAPAKPAATPAKPAATPAKPAATPAKPAANPEPSAQSTTPANQNSQSASSENNNQTQQGGGAMGGR